MDISFRHLEVSDLDNVVCWMQDAEVSRWWHDANSEEAIRAKWGPRARGEDEKTDHYVINVADCDIGLIKTYVVSDYPGYAAEVEVPDAAGISVLIGLPEWRNRGVGTVLISQFLEDIVFAPAAVLRCTIDPEPENNRAIRTYEKAGFKHARTYRSKIDDLDVYLMVVERPAL